MKQNTFNGCKYGVVLKNNGATGGIISGQGSISLRHGNTFTGPFNNTDCVGSTNCKTYTFSSDGNLSPFFVQNTTTDQPTPNGTSGGNPIIRSQGTSTSWACAAFKTLEITEGDMSDLYTEEVAKGDAALYMEFGFEESGSWFVEKELFERLKDDATLLNSDQIFQNFYETKANESVGKISEYEETVLLLTDTTLMINNSVQEEIIQKALAVNAQIVGSQVYEQNHQWVNELYLGTIARGVTEFTTSEKQALYELASKCPYADGDAVFSARTIYNLIDHSAYFDDEEICKALSVLKKEEANALDILIVMRPNPANNIVDIIIKRSEEALTLQVFNPVGQLIGTASVNNYIKLNVSSWEKGLYLIRLSDSKGKQYQSRLTVL